jgi:pimeloyl-ACP methyl ester carboxylesterase
MTTSPQDLQRSPIVLLHGATSSARAWDPLLPTLSAKHRVFVPTLAGHLGGPPLAAGSGGVISRIVDVTCGQLDEAAIDTAHVVGNSLGGWVAIEQHDRKVVNFYSHDTRVAAALVIATLGMCLVFPLIALIGVHSRQQIWQ